jgi:hypothetical protein
MLDSNADAAAPETPETTPLRCDTCGRETPVVSRVVIDSGGYNRANARALYNCPECYQKKIEQRRVEGAKRSG